MHFSNMFVKAAPRYFLFTVFAFFQTTVAVDFSTSLAYSEFFETIGAIFQRTVSTLVYALCHRSQALMAKRWLTWCQLRV